MRGASVSSTEAKTQILAAQRVFPVGQNGPVPHDDLRVTAHDLSEDIGVLLQRSPRAFWQRTSNPEFRKVLEIMLEQIDELSRLLERRAGFGIPLPADTAARLDRLLRRDPAHLRLDGAWHLVESLQLAIVTLSDRESVQVMLENEAALEMREGAWEEPWPYSGWGRVRWRDAFEPKDLPVLTEYLDHDPEGGTQRAVERLAFLHAMRAENGRKRRTMLMLRARFVVGYTVLLSALVVAFLWAAIQASGSEALSAPWVIALTAIAGAVGSIVSGVLRLRTLIRTTEFRLLGPGLVAQPLVGAAAALFLLLLMESGLVGLPRTQGEGAWAAAAAYGFLAGFLEPFLLGVVRRIADEPGLRADDLAS